jgi:chemotaxis protein histidine kinase CheA
MDELVAEFLTETNESLEELDLDLVNLEQNPNDTDLLSKIFRLVHTIKGRRLLTMQRMFWGVSVMAILRLRRIT